MQQCLLIKKYNFKFFAWDNLQRKKQIKELSTEQVIDKYQGFEGELIDFIQYDDLPEVVEKIKFSDSNSSFNLFMFNPVYNDIQDYDLVKVGYDYGVCEKEKTIYSSIFNEILFGCVVDLVCLRHLLNNNFLFPDVFTAKKYASIHHRLFLEGKDVEYNEDMAVYEIWKVKIL